MIDYKDKIKKLLALAGSNNENEAKAALLKARELMMEHKISDHDLREIKNQEIKDYVSNVTFTMRSEPWFLNFIKCIASNYCCYPSLLKNKMTYTVCFSGFEDDLEICKEVFNYAVDCIRNSEKEIIKNLKKSGYRTENIKQNCLNYCMGFSNGLKESFEKQNKETGWGLIAVTPKEVSDYVNGKDGYRKSNLYSSAGFNKNQFYEDGLKDGKDFSLERRLKQKECV